MRVGPLTVGTLFDWEPSPGNTVSWHPTPAALEKVSAAPVSSVPVSYMQAQHIRGYVEQQEKGLDYSRLMIISSDQPGQCDVRAVNYVVNAHLRRHDTYRSWFEYTDDDRIIRRTLRDAADIEFVPVKHGELTLDANSGPCGEHAGPVAVGLFSVRSHPGRRSLHLFRQR